MPLKEEFETKILGCLRQASFDLSVTEIAKETGINRNTVSKYLAVYSDRGAIIETRVLGKAKLYRLVQNSQRLQEKSELRSVQLSIESPQKLPENALKLTKYEDTSRSLSELVQLKGVLEEKERLKKELQEKEKDYISFSFEVLQSFDEREHLMSYKSGQKHQCNSVPLDWLEEKLREGRIRIIAPPNRVSSP